MSEMMTRLSSQDVVAEIKALGPQFNPDILKATWRLFDQAANRAAASCEIVPDIAYGADERQRLDVFRPLAARAPTLIYVPGGGFVGGSKVGYKRLGQHFASAGYLTLIPDYRLAPTHGWPAGATDVASVVDWAVAHGSDFGADTDRIYLFGQSAGATHVASAILDRKLRAKSHGHIRAVALMSGIYSIGSSNLAPNVTQYFGTDPGKYWSRLPLSHATNSSPPLFLLSAEFDPYGLGASTLDLAKAIYMRDGVNPRTLWMEGHNHISGVACIGTPHDNIGPAIKSFFERH